MGHDAIRLIVGLLPCSGQTGCQDCSANFYGRSPSFDSNGYYDASNLCLQCPSNKASSPGSTSEADCQDCGNDYVLSTGTCGACPAGSYTDENGNCLTCAAGQSSYLGDNFSIDRCRTVCEPGLTSDRTADGSCSYCPGGQYSPGGIDTCYQCGAGQQPDGDGASCQPCPENSFKAEGYNYCEGCGPGFTSPAGASQCTYVGCQAGEGVTFSNDGYNTPSCLPCGISEEYAVPSDPYPVCIGTTCPVGQIGKK